jgi:hypothetical protein
MISSRNDYRWSKSIKHGGDSMNDSKGVQQRRVTAFMAMLLGAIFTVLILPAYGQQEVDPSWYDPWTPNATAAHAIQLAPAVQTSQPLANHRDQQPVTSVSSAMDARKLRGNGTQLIQSRRTAARKKDGEILSAASEAQ